MIESISPNHYAAGYTGALEFTLTGSLSGIPADAVGVAAHDLSDVLEFIETTVPEVFHMNIIEKTDSRIVMRAQDGTTFSSEYILGCIVTSDLASILWRADE